MFVSLELIRPPAHLNFCVFFLLSCFFSFWLFEHSHYIDCIAQHSTTRILNGNSSKFISYDRNYMNKHMVNIAFVKHCWWLCISVYIKWNRRKYIAYIKYSSQHHRQRRWKCEIGSEEKRQYGDGRRMFKNHNIPNGIAIPTWEEVNNTCERWFGLKYWH